MSLPFDVTVADSTVAPVTVRSPAIVTGDEPGVIVMPPSAVRRIDALPASTLMLPFARK